MKRFKSIDVFRGFILLEMVWVHLCAWWLREEDLWLSIIPIPYIDRVAGPGFVFIAGVSMVLFVRNRMNITQNSSTYKKKMVRNEYYLRSFLLFLIALVYNMVVAFQFKDPTLIWTWFVVFTIACSLLLAWPIFKTPKLFRIFLAALIWLLNYFLYTFISSYQGKANLFGILYHILYNNVDLDPLPSFFSFLILGTVIGDILFDIYQIDNQYERSTALKNRLVFPTLLIGTSLIIFGLIYGYPLTLNIVSGSWICFSLGVNLLFFSILLAFEEFELIKVKKQYRFLYYFSYYSLTIYLAHNLLYLIFLHQFRWIFASLLNIGIIILIGLLFRALYRSSWRNKASLKFQLGKLAENITMRIEAKKRRKQIFNERKN